ncbi:MAG: ABC transporter substrate binding protein [Spirochaetales bacterium]|nr:ABC transporter substrate binding protein [Spirochaetales bacterium]
MKRYLFIFILLLLTSLMGYGQSVDGTNKIKNVLVIHSYHQGLYWTDSISQGIKESLKSDSVEIHFEYLDTKRNSGEEYFERLLLFEASKKQLTNIHYDLIICSDNNALRFLTEYGDSLYPNIPVVFCGINNYSPELLKGKENYTGVVEYIDYQANLDLMAQLHPKRNRVIIILDKSYTGNRIKAELLPLLNSYSDRFTFQFYQDFKLNEVPRFLSGLGKEDLIYLLTFNRDREGDFISYLDGIGMIRQNSEVPIYGSWDFYFGNGIVGGVLTTGRTQGRTAGMLARRILEGEQVASLPVINECPRELLFDYNELERFGLTQQDLPPGAIIFNEPPGVIENHPVLFLTGGIFIVLSLFILHLRYHRQKRARRILADTNRKLELKVNEKTLALREKISLIEKQNRELQDALNQIHTLKGIIPICSHCKSIRNDKGYWDKVEQYLSDNTDAVFSHSLCPDCLEKYYPEASEVIKKK